MERVQIIGWRQARPRTLKLPPYVPSLWMRGLYEQQPSSRHHWYGSHHAFGP